LGCTSKGPPDAPYNDLKRDQKSSGDAAGDVVEIPLQIMYCFTKVVVFNYCLIFTPNPEEMIQFDYIIFFQGVETNHQPDLSYFQ